MGLDIKDLGTVAKLYRRKEVLKGALCGFWKRTLETYDGNILILQTHKYLLIMKFCHP